MSGKQFAHLHSHSAYSMLDGAAHLDPLMEEAARLGQPAVAITDHGNMMGAFSAYKAGKKHGVKAIMGLEAYATPGDVARDERIRVSWGTGGRNDVSGGGAYTHLTLLAETTEGMHNLFRLSSYASLEGQYYKPRADRDLMSRYGTGVIATTGCPSGEVQTRLRLGQYKEALQAASDFRDIFGQNNYFVELMYHGLDIENRVRADLLRVAKELYLPLLATNDLHYVAKSDAHAHEALLCVQSGSQLDNPDRFKFDGEDYYLKTAQQMRAMFPEHESACDNTLLVAERCNVTFNEDADLMPRFPVPDGHSEATWLQAEVQAGLKRRYPQGVPEDRAERAEYELGVLISMGFPGYFLVVADYIEWAKRQGIRVGPGRGSAAGSLVAYALGITELDPIEHKLMFERFLNPERVSLPDIDVDFDDTRRGEVINYVSDKYGADRVSQIVTFGIVKAKAALKDSARIHGEPFKTGERLTALVPAPAAGKDMPLWGAFDPEHPRYDEAADLRAARKDDETSRIVIETALGLEGAIRQWGVHAAGVILSAEPLIDHVPIMKREADGAIITQFDQKTCETLGLLKMDFLGLRNLTVIEEALRLIGQTGQDVPVLEELPLTDPAAYALLSKGDTLGVFQLDGGPMRALLRSMMPDNFEDISAVLALYRPGPMGANAHNDYADRKNKRKPIVPIHPELAEPLSEILGDTYGLIVYQEQVMTIAQQLAGYSLGEADLFRRAMGKKDASVLQGEYARFSSGMEEKGFTTGCVEALWAVLLPFSDYAFNKAHTAAYGLISYWTAYLKANHPAQYMAALLTSTEGDKDKTAAYLIECAHMNVPLLAPDINQSGAHYTPTPDGAIRVGLSATRNVGAAVVAKIVDEREEGEFASFQSVLERTEVNKRTVDSLIKAGAFDSFHDNRAALAASAPAIIDYYAKSRKKSNAKSKTVDTFGGDLFDLAAGKEGVLTPPIVETTPAWSQREQLSFERDMLGMYVTGHPLDGSQAGVLAIADGPVSTFFPPGQSPRVPGGRATIAGVITAVVKKKTRKGGDPYVIVTIDDCTGSADVSVFPQTYRRNVDLWTVDAVVSTVVKVEHREDGSYSVMAQSGKAVTLIPDPEGYVPLTAVLATASLETEKMMVLELMETECTPTMIKNIKMVLSDSPGRTPVHIKVTKADKSVQTFALPEELWVDASSQHPLQGLLGQGKVAMCVAEE